MNPEDPKDADEILKAYGPGALDARQGKFMSDPMSEKGVKALTEFVEKLEHPETQKAERPIALAGLYRESLDDLDAAWLRDRSTCAALIARMGSFMTAHAGRLEKILDERAAVAAAAEKPRKKAKLRLVAPDEGESIVLELGDENELAKRMIRDHLGNDIVFDLAMFHRYDTVSGAWKSYERAYLLNHVDRYAGAWVVNGKDSDGIVKLKPLKMSLAYAKGVAGWVESLVRHPRFFDDRRVGCGFKNGMLTPEGDFVAKDPRHRLLESEVLPFDYEPMSSWEDVAERCPVWMSFLRQVWAPDDDCDSKIIALHQFVGRVMLGVATVHERGLFLYGPTAANGKSTTMAVLRGLFPPESRSSVPPQLMGERFQNLALATSRINMVNDMPENEICDTGHLKAMISGDELQFERKLGAAFVASPRAGHVFALNSFPPVRDKSRGFWRRPLVLTYNRSFENDPKKDTRIVKKLLKEIRHIAAACLFYALEAGDADYEEPISSKVAIEKWRGTGNSVLRFTVDFAVPESGECTPGPAIYQGYRTFCKISGSGPMSRNKFYEELERAGWQKLRTRASRGWAMVPKRGTEAYGIMYP